MPKNQTKDQTPELPVEEIGEDIVEDVVEDVVEVDVFSEESLFLTESGITETETPGFLPEEPMAAEPEQMSLELEGTELGAFESAPIEEVHFVEDERLESIIESILFASDRPVSLASLKLIFKGTNVKGDRIKRTLERLAVEYAGSTRGVTLEEVPGGYQLRTKIDNLEFLRGNLKARVFKLSGPALEVLSILAYKQPVIKAEIDQIRGVESGHLLRALMEKGLANFEGKSDFPGRPMQYGTTKKFLEIFGLRNLKELPTLSQIDELLPEGIGEEELPAKPMLSDITDGLATSVGNSYSQGEEELEKIQSQLEDITTSSDFFEQEKIRQRQKKDLEKAQNIREALAVNEAVSTRDLNWLKRYDEALARGEDLATQPASTEVSAEGGTADSHLSSRSEDVGDRDEDNDKEDDDVPHIEDEIPFELEADDDGNDNGNDEENQTNHRKGPEADHF